MLGADDDARSSYERSSVQWRKAFSSIPTTIFGLLRGVVDRHSLIQAPDTSLICVCSPIMNRVCVSCLLKVCPSYEFPVKLKAPTKQLFFLVTARLTLRPNSYFLPALPLAHIALPFREHGGLFQSHACSVSEFISPTPAFWPSGFSAFGTAFKLHESLARLAGACIAALVHHQTFSHTRVALLNF